MVDGDNGRVSGELGAKTEILAEFDGVGRVETTGRVVPALQRGVGERSFGNGDTFTPGSACSAADLLSARHTTDEVIPDNGVQGMADTKDRHDDISAVLGKLPAGDACGGFSRRASLSGESERLTDSHGGKVDVDLGGIDGFATELAVHLLGRDTYCQWIRCVTYLGN